MENMIIILIIFIITNSIFAWNNWKLGNNKLTNLNLFAAIICMIALIKLFIK